MSHVLAAVKTAVVNHDRVTFPSLPRLPDAFVWAAAATPRLEITPEAFREVLSDPPNPLVEKIVAFMETRQQWKGTATQLAAEIGLDCLPHHLSRELFQSKKALKRQGLILIRGRDRSSRSIEFAKVNEKIANERHSVTSPDPPAPDSRPHFMEVVHVYWMRNGTCHPVPTRPIAR